MYIVNLFTYITSYNQSSSPFLYSLCTPLCTRLSVPLLFLFTPSFYPLVPLPSPGLATPFPGLSPFSCHSPKTLARIQTSSSILLLPTFIGTSCIIHPVTLSQHLNRLAAEDVSGTSQRTGLDFVQLNFCLLDLLTESGRVMAAETEQNLYAINRVAKWQRIDATNPL